MSLTTDKNNIFLKVKDHSVSGEMFSLVYDKSMDMLSTEPKPSKEDLGKYYNSENYISHTDSKRNLFERAYHLVRSIALKRKVRLIKNYTPDGAFQLLDVGCGTGDFIKSAAKSGWEVDGVEPDEGARMIASQKTNTSVFEDVSTVLNLHKQYDVITLWHVLEHLPNLNEQLESFQKLLKPNGTLIVAVPNFKSYDAQLYKSFWAAYDVPRHLWHFSKHAIQNLMQSIDMEIKQILPMHFDAYYVSMLSEKNRTGSMNLLKALSNGFLSNWKARRTQEYSSLIYIAKKREFVK